jgi:hypothetical protein
VLGWVEQTAPANDQTAAEGDAGVTGSRQGFWSRNIAQQRTNNFRAKATIACFLCVLPPGVSRC